MLAFCPLDSLVSYWTNSQLQTNAACVILLPYGQRAVSHFCDLTSSVGWKYTAGRDFKAHYLCVLYRIWRVVTESLYKVSKLPNSFSLCRTELFLALFVFSKPKTVLFLQSK